MLNLRADQLLHSFSAMHPYVTFEGHYRAKTIRSLLPFAKQPTRGLDPDLWNYAEVDGTDIRFDDGKAGISEEAAAVISQAVREQTCCICYPS